MKTPAQHEKHAETLVEAHDGGLSLALEASKALCRFFGGSIREEPPGTTWLSFPCPHEGHPEALKVLRIESPSPNEMNVTVLARATKKPGEDEGKLAEEIRRLGRHRAEATIRPLADAQSHLMAPTERLN